MGPGAGRADLVIGLLLAAVSGAVFHLARGLPSPPFVPLPPSFFPRLVAGLLAFLAVLLALRGLRSFRRPPDGPPAERLAPAAIVFVVLGAYVALIPVLGFFASTFLFLLAFGWLLGERTPRGLLRPAVVAAVTTVACYVVFTRYLRVLFPEGLLR